MPYRINYRYSESGWTGPTGSPIAEEDTAYDLAESESEASRDAARKCIDAGIDVEFIVEYRIVPTD